MNRIFNDAQHSHRILQLTADTMMLVNEEGICLDVSIHSDLWFLQEDLLRGKNLFELLPEKTRQEIVPDFQSVLANQTAFTRNYSLYTNCGVYYFKCIMHPYDGNVLCQYRDITARSNVKKQLEETKRQLEQAKLKAETSDKLKSAFLANMSHEIRTPLNAIVGFSRIIMECEDPEERQQYFGVVKANNERLLHLINEILDLSKIESGIVEFTYNRLPLRELCNDVYQAHVFRCPPRVQLVFDASDPALITRTDKIRVFQVMSNLIGNALKFTAEGSISFGYKLEKDYLLFHVRDTGTGIGPDKIDKVFDRFVKANSHAQGTGLGLSICKTIVERLGGDIWVESEQGKGTTFFFTLPPNLVQGDTEEENHSLTDATNTADADKTVYKINKRTEDVVILVAEDTDSNYELLDAIIGKKYKLIRANDGIEAVTMFEEIRPDLILMDIKMPNLDGLEATKIIRQLSPGTPIIAQSAYAYEQDRKLALEAGCNDFIAKPIMIDELNTILDKWLPS